MADPFAAEKERLRQAILRSYRMPPKLIGLRLPWRVRLRLWVARRIDGTGCWLCDHRRPGAAELLWRVTGHW